MAQKVIKVRNKVKYDTEANWAKSDPVLLAGELAVSSDRNNRIKVGDGTKKWSALSFSGLKVGTNITLADDTISITKSNVTSALGYTPPTTNTTYNDVTQSSHGLMTAADKKKLDGIASGANAYTHPSATAYASGLYKITTNALGHVTAAAAVTKADITALGIPGQDTNTTYDNATQSARGLMTAADKKKLDGISEGANKITVDSYMSTSSTNPVQNKVVKAELDKKMNIEATALTNEDLNKITTYGFYYGGGSNSVTNKPAGVDAFGLHVYRSAGGYVIQELTAGNTNERSKYIRQYAAGGTWTTWITEAIFSNTPVDGRIVVTDGTEGKVKSSNFTIASSVPANAKFTDTVYTHPSYTEKASGLYKVTVDNKGHVSAATAVTKSDITALGIPGQDTNTTYTVGTESYSGTTKLYGSTGTSTDGTMTRNAITTALNGKANSSHTHNYAGSSSAGGNANAAVKLATARTVAANTDFAMSFSFDGTKDVSAQLSYYNCTASNGNKNNYPYHRFARIDKITASYNDRASTFLITQDYQGGGWGIVSFRLRTNNTSQASDVQVIWLLRHNLSADCVQVAIDTTSGATYADAFIKLTGTYNGTVIRNLASGGRGNISRTWTLNSSREADNTTTSDPLTSTECYVDIATAGTKLHNKAYTKTVTPVDAATVSYANSAGTASNVKDSGNNTVTTLAYSKSGLDSASWFAAWNNYELRAISPANALKAMGGASSSVATQSANGLLSASDKKKLDGIASGANAYSHPSATAYASGLYKITTNNLGHVTSATAVTKSDITALGIPGQDTNTVYTHPTYTAKASGLYKITVDGTGHVSAASAVTKSDITALGIPSQDTNTHYTTKLITGASATATANAASSATNNAVYLNLMDDSTIRNSHKITGGGQTSVYSDANGNITINTTILAAATNRAGLMTAQDKTDLNRLHDTVYSATQPTKQNIGDYWVKLEG